MSGRAARRLGRRAVLAGLGASLALPVAWRAGAADAEPLGAILARSGLGDLSGFAVADLATGQLLEAHRADAALPPASVAKIFTALFALDTLGGDFRFRTRLVATGPVEGDVVRGDLALVGAGDPLLDTDALGEMAAALKAAGVGKVAGRFLVADGALPQVAEIDASQPEDAAYNPAVSGLNLNFNRVHLAWSPGPALGFTAPGARFAAPVEGVRGEAGAGGALRHRIDGGREIWTLPAAALARKGERWLPVRAPGAYGGEVFRRLAADAGIELPAAETVADAPGGTVLVEHRSQDVEAMVRGMLHHSTNLTAEALGLRAAQAGGGAPRGLSDSAAAMTAWAQGRYAIPGARLVNHSGLTDASRISAAQMVRALAAEQARLPGLLRERPVLDAERQPVPLAGRRVAVKTGTLFFASALAGYVEGGGRRLGFAIFAADRKARAALPARFAGIPPGAWAWSGKARGQEQALLRRWLGLHAA